MKQKSTHTEKKIDKALEDTFPASDPPSVSGKKTREERERRDAEGKRSKNTEHNRDLSATRPIAG